MEIIKAIADIILMMPIRYFKNVYACLKTGWKKYWALALLLIATYLVGASFYYFNKIAKPTHINYINREAFKTTGVSQVVDLIEKLTSKAGHGITIAWISIEVPKPESFERKLVFSFVKGCNYNISPKNCLINSKTLNPEFYRDRHISELDGQLLEKDKIIFFDKDNPISFKELEPIILPIYSVNKGLSLEMMALEYKSPDIYKLLLKNPPPLGEERIAAIAKVRDDTFLNKRVIHLVLVTQWGKDENSFAVEGLKQVAFLIAKKIKDNILLL